MKYKIYKLVYQGKVVYIGITTMTLARRKRGNYKGTSVEHIIKECSIELIEETDDSSRERYWIRKYQETILNQRLGTGQTILDRREQIRNAYHKNKEKINKRRRELSRLKKEAQA